MMQKILRTGHSLAVTIPSEFAKKLNLRPRQKVQVSADPIRALLTCTFVSTGQMTLLPPK